MAAPLVVETPPSACGAGHLLGSGQVLVGWRGCLCPTARDGGHRTYACRAEGCGHVTYTPPCSDPREQDGRTYGR